ncbi:hypothetical protein B9T31_16295 [Acinetobacter sp. ANC 4558]|uniref:DUF6670 family protein n=1 Tax=Acinetobacter sp. ANC 4558 TaxID=1977876 RepID=UPI000A34E956|nr:DUF6670 family protein [Acinetobacter sp. ANC 4558]OTG80446.1 hypothetical protein B9T31_16295 [Acinetobacter sp. ANC 4558]
MRLFQDFLDQSKQLNQTPKHKRIFKKTDFIYHAPNKQYKVIFIGLKIPNLPAPLHYLNFFSTIGIPNSAVFLNQSAIKTTVLDTATTLVSTSPHMVGQLSAYSIKKDCYLNEQDLQFGHRESISGSLTNINIQRMNDELSFDLQICALSPSLYFSKLKFNLAEFWSLPAMCKGELFYKQQRYEIEGLASFEFAKSRNLSYMSCAFYVYQLINLDEQRQIIFTQYRDSFNHLISSRIYIRNILQDDLQFFDEQVQFNIKRIYPQIKTPNGQIMYLPREFEWLYQDEKISIQLEGCCRGDFKFGLGAGFVGSFYYTLTMNNEVFEGTGGYCEYIDCRALRWQEQNKEESLINKIEQVAPIMIKK